MFYADFTIVLWFYHCVVAFADSPVTIVSGFWQIPSKHQAGKYYSWFRRTLKINAPTVFFYDDAGIMQSVQSHRQDLQTTFVQRNLSEFRVFSLYNRSWVHKNNVPSPELAMIWLEKVSLINFVIQKNPYNSQWFAWVDAGICIYRNVPPPTSTWPLRSTLDILPTTKMIYTGYWDKYHDVFGTAFLYHISIASNISAKFYQSLQKCASETHNWMCGSDQFIFTLMKKSYPEMFFRVGGWYGEVVEALYAPLTMTITSLLPNASLPLPYLAASTMFMNESLYLKEWLDFHIRMGIDNFRLYNHGSLDDYRSVLKPYIASKIVDLNDAIEMFPDVCSHDRLEKKNKQRKCQVRAFNDAIGHFAKRRARWLAVFDVDEFIYPPPQSAYRKKKLPIKAWLADNEAYDVAEITSAVFGGNDRPDNHTVITQYKFRAPLIKTKSTWDRLNFGHKSIGWPKKIVDNSVHFFTCPNCTWKTVGADSNDMRMNHYQYKSILHQNEKSAKNGNDYVKFNDDKNKFFTSEFDGGILGLI